MPEWLKHTIQNLLEIAESRDKSISTSLRGGLILRAGARTVPGANTQIIALVLDRTESVVNVVELKTILRHIPEKYIQYGDIKQTERGYRIELIRQPRLL